jgi:hypothetical protein
VNHFMRAHGYLPGPTQRPVVAGFLSGIAALPPVLAFASYTGVLGTTARDMGVNVILIGMALAALAAGGGVLYGRIFLRAANDRRGGWLFGIGFGYLLWMAGPTALVYWIGHAPLATGRAGQVLFASHLLYGLVLGLAFPHIHAIIQRRLLPTK